MSPSARSPTSCPVSARRAARPGGASQAVIEELGYRPNRVAQSLVWRRPFALGLIIPDITNPYFPTFALGAEDRVRERGYTLVLGNSDYDPEREASYLELVRSNQLAGAIYCLGDEMSPILAEMSARSKRGWRWCWSTARWRACQRCAPTTARAVGWPPSTCSSWAIARLASSVPCRSTKGMADREGGFLDMSARGRAGRRSDGGPGDVRQSPDRRWPPGDH